MRRKIRPEPGIAEVVRSSGQNCGRSTKSTVWKISFLVLGITVALLYRRQGQHTELAARLESLSEDLTSEYLRAEIQAACMEQVAPWAP